MQITINAALAPPTPFHSLQTVQFLKILHTLEYDEDSCQKQGRTKVLQSSDAVAVLGQTSYFFTVVSRLSTVSPSLRSTVHFLAAAASQVKCKISGNVFPISSLRTFRLGSFMKATSLGQKIRIIFQIFLLCC